jgi:hypothetical protein
LAWTARRALRLYARERCIIPGRLVAEAYDGIRHFNAHKRWSTKGLSFEQTKRKYYLEALTVLGEETSQDILLECMYKLILERSCSTNSFFDMVTRKVKDIEEETGKFPSDGQSCNIFQ